LSPSSIFTLSLHDALPILGEDALFLSPIPPYSDNTALGYQAMYSNSTGQENSAVGSLALHDNTTGGANVAVGLQALANNTTGGSDRKSTRLNSSHLVISYA